MARGLDRLKAFFGGVVALVLYLVIGGLVIAFLFRGCEGNHKYMNVGRHGPTGDAEAPVG